MPVVPVFLMRDPVERIWSMVRMNQHRRPDDFPGPTSDWVRRLYAQDDHALRTRYDLTLAALDEAFGPGASWLALYEQLFDRDVLADLCDRLGIDFHEPDLSHVVNASPKGDALPDDLVAEMAAHFRSVYDATALRFPGVDLAELWPSARARSVPSRASGSSSRASGSSIAPPVRRSRTEPRLNRPEARLN